MSEKIIAYKAMNPDMTCRGKKYETGKTYFEDKADCCNAGMHACENPFEVLSYYPMRDNPRFFEVECGGEISKSDEGSKLACTELTVKGELNFAGMLKATLDAVFRRVKDKEPFSSGYFSTAGTSGDYSTAGTSGNYSTAGTSGYYSTAGTSGYYSTAAATGAYCSAKADGKDSIAVVNGACGKACGALGCYIVLTEYDDDGHMICAKMARVDGSAIREKVYYTLKNGEFVEWKP